jgi:hypothetical protein
VGEKGGELEWGLKQTLEPVVSASLDMADELEQAQLAVLLPYGDPQRRTQGGREEDQQHPSVEITERAVFRNGRYRREMQATFPGSEHSSTCHRKE